MLWRDGTAAQAQSLRRFFFGPDGSGPHHTLRPGSAARKAACSTQSGADATLLRASRVPVPLVAVPPMTRPTEVSLVKGAQVGLACLPKAVVADLAAPDERGVQLPKRHRGRTSATWVVHSRRVRTALDGEQAVKRGRTLPSARTLADFSVLRRHEPHAVPVADPAPSPSSSSALFPRLYLPQLHTPVSRPRGEELAVRGERDGGDNVGMPTEGTQHLPRGDTPQLHRVIFRP